MKKIIFSLTSLVLIFLLFSCESTPEENTPRKLITPNIALTDNVVSWEVVDHAFGYVVNKNGVDEEVQTALSYEITDQAVGDYIIKVKAVSNDPTQWTNSEYSNLVTYQVKQSDPVQLTIPKITLTNNVVSWEAVDYAFGYVVNKNGVDEEVQTALSYEITDQAVGDYIIKVKAVSNDPTQWTNSEYSNLVTYQVKQSDPVQLTTPKITLTNNVVSWEAVDHAFGYVVNKNGVDEEVQTALSYEIIDQAVGDYIIKVKAVSNDPTQWTNSEYSNPVTYTVEVKELKSATLYVVGDSTLASFSDSYFYPRYGYGTQLSNYFDKKITVNNMAISGRSSKDYLTREEYKTLMNGLKPGDFLLIGFGHNDEKSEDDSRFTDASKPLTDPTSFQYSLYEYYVKVALEKGATPILCTPVVRADSSNNYNAASGHVTANGDYAQAIIDLGKEKNITVINLRDLTKEKYTAIGFDQAIYYHAMTAGQRAEDGVTIVPNVKSVDKTHLNIYGAKYVAYLVASELAKSDNLLGKYVLSDIQEPTRDKDLVVNPSYVLSDYASPNLSAYTAPSHFSTISSGWYGTAFGDTGGTPDTSKNGYVAKETKAGVFQVGQHIEGGSTKGKFSGSGEGFAFVFQQVDQSKNFEMTADIKVIATVGTKQVGFGMMLRDDCFISQTVNSAVSSNYVTAGFIMNDGGTTNILFKRENATLTKGKDVVNSFITQNETATLKISRTGQSIVTTVIYNGETYTETTLDFDLLSVDNQYMYIGLFANRGTIIEATNVNFTITGDYTGA